MSDLPLRILVVDDDPEILSSIGRELRTLDFALTFSSDPQAALLQNAQNPAGVVLCDYQMPNRNGLDLIHEICNRWPETACILMTAFGDYDLALKIIDRNHVFKFLQKPWDEITLRSVITDALKRHRELVAKRARQQEIEDRNTALRTLSEHMHETIENLRMRLNSLETRAVEQEPLAQVGLSMLEIIHDMKSPLTAMTLSLEMLKKAPRDDKHGYPLEVIGTSLNYMVQLTQSIPDYVRDLTAEIDYEATDLAGFVLQASRILEPLFASKSVALIFDLQPGIAIELDPIHMTRAIQNLLKNALEATPSGFVRVTAAAAGHGAEIRIEDSGAGLPDEIRQSLFRPFVTFGKSAGLGLGLAATRAIVERHHGQIEALNTQQGACFTIRLPLTTAPTPAASACDVA